MGSALSRMGGKDRSIQLYKWKEGPNSIWNLQINETEVCCQLLNRKRRVEAQLENEVAKRRKLEKEVTELKNTNVKQAKEIVKLKTGRSVKSRGPSSSKRWNDYSRQHQWKKKKGLANNIQTALSFCDNEGFKPCSVEIKNIDTGANEILDLSTTSFNKSKSSPSENKDTAHSALYIKDRFSISNEAYHELSMVSDLPRSCRLQTLVHDMNSQFAIRSTPNGIIGVQQSLKDRITARLKKLVNNNTEELPHRIRVKITGDGTLIARNLNVVNIAFTILEEGRRACSVSGNHTVAILKVPESYETLSAGLEDICEEVKNLESIDINGETYDIEFYIGGDWKFLAMICGLESATSTYACIWCKCPKSERWDMSKEWSITDTEQGARTVDEITNKSKLAKTSNQRFNCARVPLFSTIPLNRVVIDSLHLFLRISDVLINLLIRDLRILDGVGKATNDPNSIHLKTYENFLNKECKIRFRWFVDKESKTFKWRDLTGPEKIRLFQHIDHPTLFPALEKKHELQLLWSEFFNLISILGKSECDVDEFQERAKEWVKLFTSLYQTKDVTPYMHAFTMHVPEFIRLHGNITMFTQQGLEKLNDLTTKYFQRGTNHHEEEALRQILERINRIETLEDAGYSRQKRSQKCSICGREGHNKRSCSSRPSLQEIDTNSIS